MENLITLKSSISRFPYAPKISPYLGFRYTYLSFRHLHRINKKINDLIIGHVPSIMAKCLFSYKYYPDDFLF